MNFIVYPQTKLWGKHTGLICSCSTNNLFNDPFILRKTKTERENSSSQPPGVIVLRRLLYDLQSHTKNRDSFVLPFILGNTVKWSIRKVESIRWNRKKGVLLNTPTITWVCMGPIGFQERGRRGFGHVTASTLVVSLIGMLITSVYLNEK